MRTCGIYPNTLQCGEKRRVPGAATIELPKFTRPRDAMINLVSTDYSYRWLCNYIRLTRGRPSNWAPQTVKPFRVFCRNCFLPIPRRIRAPNRAVARRCRHPSPPVEFFVESGCKRQSFLRASTAPNCIGTQVVPPLPTVS